MKLASFDIFDTTLIRKCGSSDMVFHILAKRLYPEDSNMRDLFYSWRNSINKMAWSKFGLYYTIRDIYNDIEFRVFSSNYTSEEVICIEENLESDLLFANKQVQEKIKELRDSGYVIAFISDMYLPGSVLRNALIKENCFEQGDLLYVSNECKSSKNEGTLYDYVREELCPEEWIHFGDNKQSDVLMARKKGITSIHVNTDCTELERKIEEQSCYNRTSLSSTKMFAGILRTVRLSLGNTPLINLSVDCMAAIYVPYVHYILKCAKEKNQKKLYFLSRDSFILMHIAEVMDHEDIELKFLFCSRKALANIDERSYLKAYFIQEGLPEDVAHAAIVDVGWIGTTRKMINECLHELGVGDIFFYYYSIYGNPISSCYGKYDYFLRPKMPDYETTTFIEDFCSLCPWPSTIGYNFVEGKWVPRFATGLMYKENEYITTNTLVVQKVTRCMQELDVDDNDSLYVCSYLALRGLSDFSYAIDFTPLLGLISYDIKPMVKKLTFIDTINILFREVSVSGLDRASLEISFGYNMMNLLWGVKKLNHIMYNRIRLIKQRLFKSL